MIKATYLLIFDKFAALVVVGGALYCVMSLATSTTPLNALQTTIVGGLLVFLGDARKYLFSALTQETNAVLDTPHVAPPVVVPVIPQQTEPVIPAITPVQ